LRGNTRAASSCHSTRRNRDRRGASSVTHRAYRSTVLARFFLVSVLDRVDELVFVHLGSAGDVQALRHVVEVLLRGVRIDSGGALAAASAGTFRLRVRGTLLVLRFPAVADLFEGVLQRRIGGAVRAFSLTVFLDRRIMGLRKRALGLCRGLLQSARQLTLLGFPALVQLRHGSCLSSDSTPHAMPEKDFFSRGCLRARKR